MVILQARRGGPRLIVADTTFLVHLLRRHPDAQSWLSRNAESEIFTTQINAYELYIGAHTIWIKHGVDRFDEVLDLLSLFDVLDFDGDSAYEAARLAASLQASGQTIGTRDQMIAGSALANDITKILTRNVKHFTRIQEIEVLTY